MDVFQAIRLRRSVRAFLDQPIADDQRQQLRQALRYAPSACNIQPWRFLFVTEWSMRQRLAEAANEQLWIASAPLIVVACGYPADAYPRMAGRYSSVDMDLAIALDHLSLAAVELGLGSCWIGAFNEPAVRELLNVPDEARVVAMMPVGPPADPAMIRDIDEADRKPEQEIFGDERWE